jgi:hypothetical protein
MNDDGVNRQRILARLHTYPEAEVILYFERESSNFFDSNAVMVIASVFGKNGSVCIGYLSADLAREVAPLLDEGHRAVVFFQGITGVGKEYLGVNFCFTILAISNYNLNSKTPQIAC